MREEQSRYLGRTRRPADREPGPTARALHGSNQVYDDDDPDTDESPIDPNARIPEPAFASVTQSDPKQLAGSLLQMHRAIESLEVCAGHAEQLVMRKAKDENQGQSNRAAVAPLTDGQTIAATLEWLVHRLNTTNDRLVQALGRLDSLVI
jgi:hypothetical protein